MATRRDILSHSDFLIFYIIMLSFLLKRKIDVGGKAMI